MHPLAIVHARFYAHACNLKSKKIQVAVFVVPQVLKELDAVHCVVEDLSQDVQKLVSHYGGAATLAIGRTPSGREIVRVYVYAVRVYVISLQSDSPVIEMGLF